MIGVFCFNKNKNKNQMSTAVGVAMTQTVGQRAFFTYLITHPILHHHRFRVPCGLLKIV